MLVCRLCDADIVYLFIHLKSWHFEVILQNCGFRRLQASSIELYSVADLMFVEFCKWDKDDPSDGILQ